MIIFVQILWWRCSSLWDPVGTSWVAIAVRWVVFDSRRSWTYVQQGSWGKGSSGNCPRRPSNWCKLMLYCFKFLLMPLVDSSYEVILGRIVGSTVAAVMTLNTVLILEWLRVGCVLLQRFSRQVYLNSLVKYTQPWSGVLAINPP